jgi:OmpA-OmpF porin, OOP family
MIRSIKRSVVWCVLSVGGLANLQIGFCQPLSAEQIQEQLSKPRLRTLRNLQVERVPAPIPEPQTAGQNSTAPAVMVVPAPTPVAPTAPQQVQTTAPPIVPTIVDAKPPIVELPITTSNNSTQTSLVKDEPAQIALQIQFEFNSIKVTPQGELQIRELAKALASAALEKIRFQVQGHTDAVGRADYNLRLSQQRADTIARFLQTYGIERSRLSAVGMGQTQLLRDYGPAAPEQRRVVIIEKP